MQKYAAYNFITEKTSTSSFDPVKDEHVCFTAGYPGSPNHPPYPQPGQSAPPYPVPAGGYPGDPSQAPPPGFGMGYHQGQPPVMYQPGPAPGPGPDYGGQPMGMSPAPAPVGVPPGLEYLTQVVLESRKHLIN